MSKTSFFACKDFTNRLLVIVLLQTILNNLFIKNIDLRIPRVVVLDLEWMFAEFLACQAAQTQLEWPH